MSNETKILVDNIKTFRKLPLNESYNEQSLVDAINQHKVLFIGYDGDDTIMAGQRTILPFVLGTHKKSGNRVLRAWEQAGASDSFNGLNRQPRKGHEYHDGPFGRKPGWRLFLLDGITSVVPTGRVFDPEKYFVTSDGVKYNPDDNHMSNIEVAIAKEPAGKIQTTGTDSVDQPDVVGRKIDKKSAFDPQSKKWQFFKAAKKSRDATKDEIEGLWKTVTQYWKENTNKFWVVQDENGDMVLKRENQVKNLPPESVVGKLRDLYNKYVVSTRKYGTGFHEKQKNDTRRELDRK